MPHPTRSLARRFCSDQRGSVLVEMTLITPLMIALSAGVFEFGNLFYKKLLIEAGLRDAARYAARCNQTFQPALDCEANARNIAVFGNVSGTGAARVSGWTTAVVTVDQDYLQTDAVVSDVQVYRSDGDYVYTVRAATSFAVPPADASLLAYIGLGTVTLTASQEERYVGW
ncbi:TadE/TadG family type IV pilus assembly protein [Nitratireductor sp. ZSWI3]|uniref:TadE/TadG family type IV pilus assembly protein n=1 Tax=Nitratireductor sp. ZSWI3 TaxID=2966359 RepID=UPI0021504854|nr:TadE/TadG family type IV pilus assembly protein [Nitratireductor sp. ZSWI3]MCR4264853.1 pilus assembly protein [Nitratireductor sp. ZSWI3]